MRQTLDLCRELPVFFDQWCVYSRFTPLEDKLPAFFDELKKVLTIKNDEQKKEVFLRIC